MYSLSPKQIFADAVTRENEFWRLLQLVERPEPNESSEDDRRADGSQIPHQRKDRAWLILESLSSSTSVADTILSTAGWIELLGVLVGYAEFTKLWTARVGAAKTLSRLLWDPTTGPVAGKSNGSRCDTAAMTELQLTCFFFVPFFLKLDSLLKRFLPATLTLRLKEDPEAMLRSFDGSSDTPELIWDASMRGELRKALGDQLEAILKARNDGSESYSNFVLGPEAFVRYPNLERELYIGKHAALIMCSQLLPVQGMSALMASSVRTNRWGLFITLPERAYIQLA